MTNDLRACVRACVRMYYMYYYSVLAGKYSRASAGRQLERGFPATEERHALRAAGDQTQQNQDSAFCHLLRAPPDGHTEGGRE